MRRIRLGRADGGTEAFVGAVHRIVRRIDGRYERMPGEANHQCLPALVPGQRGMGKSGAVTQS